MVERLNFKGAAENTVRNYVNELREMYPIPKSIRQREYTALPENLLVFRAKWILDKRLSKERLEEANASILSLSSCLIPVINM